MIRRRCRGRGRAADVGQAPAPTCSLAAARIAGAGIALALPVVSAATGHLVAARTLSHAIDALPVGERTVIASYGGTADPAEQEHDDGLVREGLARLSSRPAVHQMLYGELADSVGETYRVGATDELARRCGSRADACRRRAPHGGARCC